MRLLLLLLLCAPLYSQGFDESRSQFLSSPHGRTGTWAPFRAVLTGLDGLDTVTVRSVATGVVLRQELAVGGRERAEVILPVYVHESARLEVGDEVLHPTLPLRRIQPDYSRSYTAVFSSDPLYARAVLPTSPTGAVCDYYELGEFFTDWRLLDGYDAIVIFNPTDVRLPAGSQGAIAEFCSLGGAVLVVGSFRLGEQAVDVPPPADPTLPVFRGVQAQRYGYGAGAIYRVGFNDLRRKQNAHLVIEEILRDHQWFGATDAPGGTPESRIPSGRPPHPAPLPPPAVAPTPLFWGLAGALLLLCAIAPLVAGRAGRVWLAQPVLIVGCTAIAAAAMLQDSPLPTLETSTLVRTGEGEAASARMFVQVEQPWGDTLHVNLADTPRDLPRRVSPRPRWRAWVIDRPLVVAPQTRANAVTLQRGRVGTQTFRDFATATHRAATSAEPESGSFSTGEAALIEWWLDANAYRGRVARIAPLETPAEGFALEGTRGVERGAIGVTPVRE